MPNLNTFADISSYVNNMLEDSLLVARENGVMPALVTTFSMTGSNPRKVYEYNESTVNDVSEADDFSSQAFTPSLLSTLTPSEVGQQYFITDQRIATDWSNARNDAVQDMGLGMAKKIDTDLVGGFSSFTGGTVQPTLNMTWGAFLAAITTLRAQYAPQPYVFVCHPYQWHSLGTALAANQTVTNSPMLQDEFVRNWFVGNCYGVDCFVDGNITDGTAAGATTAGMFSRAALALDIRRAPRLEIERDASRRGYEFNMSAVYAHGVWRPKFGVQINTSGSVPIS